MHRNARSERSLNHRKANYDPDQFTEENSKNPSLNSTLGCLKVVDTFRSAALRVKSDRLLGISEPWRHPTPSVDEVGLTALADEVIE